MVVRPGDAVMGTWLEHLTAEVCRRGGRCAQVVLDVEASDRGKGRTIDDLEVLGAELLAFVVMPASH